jgi:hypothetical protein
MRFAASLLELQPTDVDPSWNTSDAELSGKTDPMLTSSGERWILHMRTPAIALLGKDVKSPEPARGRLGGITATSVKIAKFGTTRGRTSR